MNKIGAIAIVIGLVIFTYLFLIVTMPLLTNIVSSANMTMAATSNMSSYPGTSAAIVSVPWIIFFIPGVIGMFLIIMILKRP